MKSWSYKIVEFNTVGFFSRKYDKHLIEKELNQLGSEGWELVNSFTVNAEGGVTKQILFTMKKEMN